VCRANLALQHRAEERALGDYVPGALLPDPALAAHTLPEEEILASLLSWSQLYEGRALRALGRPGEAVREWEAVVRRGQTGPSTSPGRKKLDDPKAWAALELAKTRLAARDVEGAQQWLHQAGSWNKEIEAERKRLQAEVQKLRNVGGAAGVKKTADEFEARRKRELEEIRRRAAEFEARRKKELEEIKKRGMR
jgi:hypothetical protein